MSIIFTGRVGYPDADGLDITIKSATDSGIVLAPTWAMVGGVKRWQGYEPLTPQQYVDRYYQLLCTRFRANRQPFLELIRRERLVLLCYCRAGAFCHRHFAVDILEKIACTVYTRPTRSETEVGYLSEKFRRPLKASLTGLTEVEKGDE